MLKATLVLIGSLLAARCWAQPVTVTKDDTEVTRSCKVVIPPGTVIADANGNGVIHIKSDNIVVEFAEGSVLRGAPEGVPWDRLSGVGIRLDGHKGVAIWNAHVRGYKVGIYATSADKLEVSKADLSDNYRQHLKSTPWAEDGSDWLWPHKNDDREWMTQYGAALCVERSNGPVIREVTVRRGQNGIILDRVNGAMLYDNDCSFLTGWGLAMWRSNNNRVMRNSFDFCVRGYSHGVYNRGQDSAGILCFEQCSDNVFAENSATHGGDGFFGFAGREAIGEAPAPPGFDYARKGCNDNLLIDNDFSYAAAHGIEMTFSYGNRYVRNHLVEDAICGVWGGYSQDTLIAYNRFERNGQGAYGLERGGVNIEHGANNRIVHNSFLENACGVHLWWDNDGGLFEKPGVKANYKDVVGNVIANNRFEGDAIGLQLRDAPPGHVKGTIFVGNTVDRVAKPIDAPPGAEPVATGTVDPIAAPSAGSISGKARTRSNAPPFKGRDKIAMTEWGPWDVQSPLARLVSQSATGRIYEVLLPPRDLAFEFEGQGLTCTPVGRATADKPPTFAVKAVSPGVFPYRLRFKGNNIDQAFSGTVVGTSWNITFFPWGPDSDPRKDLGAWRGLAKGSAARGATLESLNLKFGGGGPSNLKLSEEITKGAFKPDYFGTIATAAVPLTKGRWRVTTTSDDGVRVIVNGKSVIENWTWHGPTKDTGEFTMDADGKAEITVEHFEIDGFSVLDFEIDPVD